MAATTLVFFILSLGEFSAFAPALWIRRLPASISFPIPSRYTIGVTLFGTLAVAAAARDVAARRAWTRARQLSVGVICVLAALQLIVVNRAHFRDAFSLPPLDSGFRILKGISTLGRDPTLSARAPDSPMLRALMRDESVLHCDESLQLTRGADFERPLVWPDGDAKISSIVFEPNRVQFSAAGAIRIITRVSESELRGRMEQHRRSGPVRSARRRPPVRAARTGTDRQIHVLLRPAMVW